MPDNVAQPIRDALIHHRSAWIGWLHAVEKSVSQNEIPNGREAAELVRDVLQLSQDISPARQIGHVCAAFGIEKADQRSAATAQGWAKMICSEPALFAQEHIFKIAAGPAPTSRRQLVLAHEIAHFFYACLEERAASSAPKRVGSRTLQEEQFCWDFAIELSCPYKKRQEWTLEFIQEILLPKERILAESLSSHRLDQISYWHLRRLAAYYHLSIRAIIRALDRHPLLDEAATGVAVFREIPNQWTGRETGLRLWQYARPSWGHIISNKRASKQGFSSARSVFDELDDQQTMVMSESLNLWQQQMKMGEVPPDNQARIRWKQTRCETPCAYTAVDVKSEGRYVVAIWRWPKPL